jgi:diguanylate cyclase (GGDEF)-like protein
MSSDPNEDAADARAPWVALFVSSSEAHVARVRGWLDGVAAAFTLETVPDLASALARLRERAFRVLLIDLASLGGERLAWLDPVRRANPSVPVIALSDRDDPDEALEMLRDGAQDYLDMHAESPRRIVRCIRHAIERHRLIAELRDARRRAQFAATHDPLTLLPNRHLFEEQVQRAIPHALRKGTQAALLFVDLDRFKSINDSLGHAAGDEVLVQVADRLSCFTRSSDVVARVGGDEFLILMTDVRGEFAPSTVANKIQELLAPPLLVQGREHWVGASIGVAVLPRDGEDVETLMRRADLALYQAKAAGRGTFRFYSDALNEAARRRHTIEYALRRALGNGGLRIVYQPIFTAGGLDIVAAEALLRWTDPELGTVSPTEFVAVAENSGLIVPLGEAVLRTACEQLAQWKHEGHELRMTVNLSAHQIEEERLRELVVRAIWDSDLEPSELELEITESALMRDEQVAQRTFAALKKIGVRVSLDDFGTGFSSLSYLRRFPVDTVKIDRSFIRDIAYDPDDAAIVSAILSIARQLDLNVVAEGVETEQQRLFLVERMCPELQGFLFSPALPGDEFAKLLRSRDTRSNRPA